MDSNIISSASWPNSQATNATVRGSSASTTSSSKRLSQNERILQLLEGLQPNRLSLLTILIKVLDPSEKDFSKVYSEMDDIKDDLRGSIKSITPEFLVRWEINSTIGEAMDKRTPILTKVLLTAAQTDRAVKENIVKDSSTACKVMITQLAKQRSNHSIPPGSEKSS
ncbi:hypothetical protein PAXINDRAFT_19428 [Paxillus involutus ATCC 200175]|uniref:Uncharacterized protein n=1 Tax=Paxillus involutus ATCC 200175 TaxID=664439 RepID=A0A0C9TH84_PAXIN|nr:hypothetical protein PAXINDRAFT_19428 [Paxillus involutus ATCC 200175]